MKHSSLGLAIAAVAFGASTVYLAVQLRDERARAEQVVAQTRALNARIAELEQASGAQMEMHPGGGVISGGALAQSGPLPEAAPRPNPSALTPETRVYQPPERSEAMRKMMRTQMRAHHKRVYADLAQKLGLTQEDANKLFDLITDQQIADMERARNHRPGDPPLDLRQKNLDQVAALIGHDKLPQFEDYQESMPARQEVEMLTRQMEGNDLTLSEEQRDRLVAALSEERKRIPTPAFSQEVDREKFIEEMSAWNQDYQERAAARARSILNSEQMASFDEYQQFTREMRRSFETRRAQRADGNVMMAEPVTVPAAPPR